MISRLPYANPRRVPRNAYRPSSSNRGLLIVLLCIMGSVGLHGVAYAVLRHIRKPKVEERLADEVIKERKAQRKKRRKVRLLKPRIPPRRVAVMAPAMRAPRRARIERRPMTPPMTPPMQAPMQAPLDLTTPPMGAGVNPNLTATNGEGTVGVGSSANGDPTVAPMRPRPRPMRVAPMRPPPPPRRRRVVIYVKRSPVPIRVPQVPYPRAAKRANIEGTVKLEVTVGTDGRVLRVRVLKRLGYGLDEAAVRALRRARFKPAMGSDGKPMVYKLRYKYTFRLEQ